MNTNDIKIIRELAAKYMEIATSEEQQKMNQRMKDTNDLKLVRPPLLIDEIPWGQMNIDDELTCRCEDKDLRSIEYNFRTVLYRAKHFRADRLLDPFWRVPIACSSTGNGLPWGREETISVDSSTYIVSHKYYDVLEDESSLDNFHLPEFTLHPEEDERNMNYYSELFGDVMPVQLCGHGYLYCSPWDTITFLRGVEPILVDMYDRPEHLHRIIKCFTDTITAELDFFEKYSHVDNTAINLHCTPGQVSGLAEDGWKATWFRGMAQTFSSVSPEMHKEFEIDYIKPIAERFAYSYYGCCEPLDNKFDVITKIENLRKIGVSPWANVELMAEQIGKNYVLSRKPNPANVAIATDPDVIRKEIGETARLAIKYGCPCDITLKDISTVSSKPENLILWSQIASEVLDEYFGKD